MTADDAGTATARPIDLRCEDLAEPLGVDARVPCLNWRVETGAEGWRQGAYRVVVSSTLQSLEARIGDLWDSGRVESDSSVHVRYAGADLASGQRCVWAVRVWDDAGRASEWSEPAVWEMGLLRGEDWRGEWIGAPHEPWHSVQSTQYDPAPHFRRAFDQPEPVERARLYICGVGYHEVRLNGEKVGAHVLDPAATQYQRQLKYVVHDVTGSIRAGENALGVILGNGWFNMHTIDNKRYFDAPWRGLPRFLLQLVLDTQSSRRSIVSDESWRYARGPIVFDSVRNGESYDARRELGAWDTAGYDAGGWKRVAAMDAPSGRLTSQMMPPMRVTETITPVSVTDEGDGTWLFDLGRTISGWAHLRASGEPGDEITLQYRERPSEDDPAIHDDGPDHVPNDVYVLSGDFQTDRYTIGAEDEAGWEPRFTYHGFRYVRASGFRHPPERAQIEGRVVHTDLRSVGRFECSNELLNSIHEIARNAYQTNWHGYPEDCPQREKCGWIGDTWMAAAAGMLNFDVASSLAKWLDDIADAQREDGAVPAVIPTAGWGYPPAARFGPVNEAGLCILPWQIRLYTGDDRPLRRLYPTMKRYVDYVASTTEGDLVPYGLGDWLAPWRETMSDRSAVPLFSSMLYRHSLLLVADAAELVGRPAEAAVCRTRAERVRGAINRRFFDETTGRYADGSQSAQAGALYHDLAPPNLREAVAARLVERVHERDGHLETGFVGTFYLLATLSEIGRDDLMYTIATQRDYPGWGCWIEHGATTLWERWNGTASRNHPWSADISGWMFRALGGIRPDPSQPGFRNTIIAPKPVGDLRWAEAEHEGRCGTIATHWERNGDELRLQIELPPNSTATVHPPGDEIETEAGEPVRADGPLEVGSGRHVFVSRMGE